MTDNVINLNNITTLDLPVDGVLKGAEEMEMTEVVILGYDKEGDFYFASSKSDGGSILWLLECARTALMIQSRGDI